MKVFLDTNILIDFISGRKPFVEYSAQDAGADYIITRNKGDFPIDRVAVLTPKEFFNILNISL